MAHNTERRHFEAGSGLRVERRCGCDGSPDSAIVSGTAVVFNSDSNDLGGFIERMAPTAFDDFFESRDATKPDLDVVALWNHDGSQVLGRTPRTLRLSKDERGVHFELELPRSREAIAESIERGDVSACSFGFVVGKGNDSWSTDEQGRSLRTVNRVERFIEVSLVTHPAYPATSLEVARRSHDEFLASREALRSRAKATATALSAFIEARAGR